MTTPKQKGNILEDAVKAIEHAILESSPSLEKDTFIIESNKIVVVDGVRHEYDVWTEIDHGKEYHSTFVFECKNWEEKVGKNEIIVFSEKIDAVQAEKGFFIARSFTKDAMAQAKKNKRIRLLDATEHPIENIPTPFYFHVLIRENEHGELLIDSRDKSDISERTRVDMSTVNYILNEKSIDLDGYAKTWINECVTDHLKTFPSVHKDEGTYKLTTRDVREFQPGELIVNDRDIERLTMDVSYDARIHRPAIISHYEVATRGRIISLAPTQVEGGGNIQMSFVYT